jgi:hypothetical protein
MHDWLRRLARRVLRLTPAVAPSLLLAAGMLWAESNSSLATWDVFTPMLSPNDNLQAFASPWHPSSFGYAGNGPNAYLYAFILEAAGANSVITQHILLVLPLIVTALGAYLLFSTLGLSWISRCIGANLFCFNAAFLNQLPGATGLLYFYSAIPLIILFSYRLYSKSGRPIVNAIGFAASCFYATFSSTLTILLTVIILLPVWLAMCLSLILGQRKTKDLGRFAFWQFVGFVLYLASSAYTYFPWVAAVLAPNSTFGSYISGTNGGFLTHNIYIANGFSSAYQTPMTALLVPLTGPTATLYGLILGVMAVFVALLPLLTRQLEIRLREVYFGVWIFLLGCGSFLWLAVYDPKAAFSIATSVFPPLLALNEPAEWWYVIVPWIVILLTVSIDEMSRAGPAPHPFRWLGQVKAERRSKSWIRAVVNRRYHVFALTVSVVILVATSAQGIPYAINYVQGGSSQPYDIGNSFSIPNHVPRYVDSLISGFENNMSSGPFRVLWLPSYPGIQIWSQSSPYFISFPTSSQIVDSDLTNFLAAINSNSSCTESAAVTSLAIKYVVVLRQLNETGVLPTVGLSSLGAYGILGDPADFAGYLLNQPCFKLVSFDTDYLEFQNLEFHGLFSLAYAGLVDTVDQPLVVGNDSSYSVPVSTNNSFNPVLSPLVNLIADGSFASKSPGWSGFGSDYSARSVTLAGEPGLVVTPNGTGAANSTAVSLNLVSPSTPNYVAVTPGQLYNFSSYVRTLGTAEGYVDIGAQLCNESAVCKGYIQTDLLKLTTNQTATLNGSFDVPNGTFYVWPYIVINAPFSGELFIANVSLTFSGISLSSSAEQITARQESSTVTSMTISQNLSALPGSSRFVTLQSTGSMVPPSFPTFSAGGYTSDSPQSNNIIVTVPSSVFRVAYGHTISSGGTITLASASRLTASLEGLEAGAYDFFLQFTGWGTATVGIASQSDQVVLGTFGSDGVWMTSPAIHGAVQVAVTDYVGTLSIDSFVVAGPDPLGSLGELLFAAAPSGIQPESTVLSSDFSAFTLLVRNSTGSSAAVIMAQSYQSGWLLTDVQSSLGPIEGVAVNGWEIGFVLPSLGNGTLRLAFNPGWVFSTTLIVQLVTLPLMLLLALVIVWRPHIPVKLRRPRLIDSIHEWEHKWRRKGRDSRK